MKSFPILSEWPCARRNISRLASLAAAFLVVLHLCGLCAGASAEGAVGVAYRYLGRYPDNGKPNWGDNDTATQGIAHDDSNWYICATGTGFNGIGENADWIIWRIPIAEPLNQDFSGSRDPGVRHVRRSEVPQLHRIGVNHPGDLDHYRYKTTDYLLVPMRGASPSNPLIVAFRASDLKFLSFFPLAPTQQSIGWCAITPAPEGNLVTSDDDASTLHRYEVDWERLASSGVLSLAHERSETLLNADGTHPLYLQNIQGGEFTPNGELLCVNCGVSLTELPTDGLHVFDTHTWKEVARSTNPERHEQGEFSYSFDNGAFPPDEPQGLTFWDLDDGRAPSMRGQLHVLVYSWRASSSNKVTLMHYSGANRGGNTHKSPDALREYPIRNEHETIEEARTMLQWLGAFDIQTAGPGSVSGLLRSDLEVTIWAGSHGKTRCYGVRYGRPVRGRLHLGDNSTYIEVCP